MLFVFYFVNVFLVRLYCCSLIHSHTPSLSGLRRLGGEKGRGREGRDGGREGERGGERKRVSERGRGKEKERREREGGGELIERGRERGKERG